MTPRRWSGPVIMAEFASMDALCAAGRRLRDLGYHELEFYSPYPVEDADTLLGLRRPRSPRAVLLAGVAGAVLTFAAQGYLNAVDYPINVGGRPLFAVPAWIPITFELSVLAGAFAAVIALLVSAGLPRYWHPVFEIDDFTRVTVDRYWIAVGRGDAHFDPLRTRADLERLGPIRVVTPGEAS